MIKTGIIGSTGYAGEFLVRILASHPEAELTYVASAHASGKDISDVLPSLKGMAQCILLSEDPEAAADACDVVFMAKKSAESMKYAPLLLEKGVKVIDIGGEFRLRDAGEYEKWYGTAHLCPELLRDAVYGMCELNRDSIRNAQLLSNPGCYPTASILALDPLVKAYGKDILSINISASSGISGAGRTALSSGSNLFVNCFNSHSAYKAGTHKHTPEIEQALGRNVTFIPQLASMDRGILAVSCLNLREGALPQTDPADVLEQAYGEEPFIRLQPAAEQVTASGVRGTNFIDLHAVFIERTGTVLAVSAIDNLVKGASGQAVQNMNIMFGLEETMGLYGESF